MIRTLSEIVTKTMRINGDYVQVLKDVETPNKKCSRQNRVLGYLGILFVLIPLVLFISLGEHRYLGVKTMMKMAEHVSGNDTHISPEPLVHQADTNQVKQKKYLVLWYKVLAFLGKRRQTILQDFSKCRYNNCELTFNKSLARDSDAVLFDGRNVRKVQLRKRKGQIWVFAAHESPVFVKMSRAYLKMPKWKGEFNWTMTYDKGIADIHLPYGEIKKRNENVRRDFRNIAKNKTKGAIIITSHCNTHSKRMQYINELKKHTDVTVLGTCGTKWNCGVKTIHDDCFDILNNTYAFYLAFENALCDNYHTEKLFENFKYDILIVTRGGKKGKSSSMFPTGSVISVDDFDDVKQLGRYLTHLTSSKEEYAKLLEEKSQYYAVDYADIYQEALCDLCYRMNHQEQFHKVIPDITDLFRVSKSCTRPK